MSIEVKICTGTTCYVMGGAELLAISDHLTDAEKSIVEIKGSTCLGFCKEENDSRTNYPYALVNNKVIEKCDLAKLLTEIRAEI